MTHDLDVASLRDRLGFPSDATNAVARLRDVSPAPGAFELPGAEEARERLELLGISPDAVDEIVAAIPAQSANPEAWWLLERMHHELVRGDADPLWWPWPEPTEDPLSRYFQLYAFLAAVPRTKALFAARGIPEEVLWATLQDVALAVESYRARHGRPGFDSAFWFAQHFRARTFRLGRLLFNIWQVVFDPGPGAGFAEGDPALGVHMPSYGRLRPDACDESFSRAREFFPLHFPELGPFRVAACASWLLDPQLAEYLPETSNIVRFQRRFTLARSWLPGNEAMIRFVFGHMPDRIEQLPQRTTLERAVVLHLKSGRHWQIRNGWIPL